MFLYRMLRHFLLIVKLWFAQLELITIVQRIVYSVYRFTPLIKNVIVIFSNFIFYGHNLISNWDNILLHRFLKTSYSWEKPFNYKLLAIFYLQKFISDITLFYPHALTFRHAWGVQNTPCINVWIEKPSLLYFYQAHT